MATRPPAPEFPAPTFKLIEPPAPEVAAPVFKTIEPLLPLDVVPVLKDIKALVPCVPESEVLKLKDPLVVLVPYPLDKETAPPVKALLPPACTEMRLPLPVEPVPARMLTLPAVPCDAAPERRVIDPVLPEEEVPVLNDSVPLVPEAPASAVRRLNEPLVLDDPYPVESDTAPPVVDVLSPAATTKRPACELLVPTTTLTLPEAPPVEWPLAKTMEPLLPALAEPVCMTSCPLEA